MLGARGYKGVTNVQTPRLIQVTTLSRGQCDYAEQVLAQREDRAYVANLPQPVRRAATLAAQPGGAIGSPC